jgi:hypothetical protein
LIQVWVSVVLHGCQRKKKIKVFDKELNRIAPELMEMTQIFLLAGLAVEVEPQFC